MSDPGFWLALAVCLSASGFFIRWMFTGGRKGGSQPKNRPPSDPGV